MHSYNYENDIDYVSINEWYDDYTTFYETVMPEPRCVMQIERIKSDFFKDSIKATQSGGASHLSGLNTVSPDGNDSFSKMFEKNALANQSHMDTFSSSNTANFSDYQGGVGNTDRNNDSNMSYSTSSEFTESSSRRDEPVERTDITLLKNNSDNSNNSKRDAASSEDISREPREARHKTDTANDKELIPKSKSDPNPSENLNPADPNGKSTAASQPRPGEENPDPSTQNTDGKTNAPNSLKNLNSLKEIIQNSQIHFDEVLRIKTNIKESFSEAKAATASDHLEKVMLKNVQDQNKNQKTKNSDHNNNNSKSRNEETKTPEPQVDKKIPQESADTAKKDDKPVIKTESKSQVKETVHDSQSLNLQNSNKDNTSVAADPKLKTVSHPQNIKEQYELMKESISNHLEDGIKMMVAKGENKVNIQLTPPELGKVHVELIMKDNTMSAKVHAENQAVKEVIMTNMDQLKSNLENSGIHIEKFDVEVGGFQNQFDRQFGKEGSGNNRGSSGGGGYSSGDQNDGSTGDRVKNQRPVSYFLGRSINLVI